MGRNANGKNENEKHGDRGEEEVECREESQENEKKGKTKKLKTKKQSKASRQKLRFKETTEGKVISRLVGKTHAEKMPTLCVLKTKTKQTLFLHVFSH